MKIGDDGMVKGNLVIPQGCSRSFSIVHKRKDGQIVDHSQSTAKMVAQDSRGKPFLNMSQYVTCEADRILVNIPGEATAYCHPGEWPYDLIVKTASGSDLRMLYGMLTIVDTYSNDKPPRRRF